MKIKLDIDLDDVVHDMFHDEENSISEALRGHIMNGVIRKILPVMKSSIEDQITNKISKIMIDRVSSAVDEKVKDFVGGEGVVMIDGKRKTLPAHIGYMFENCRGWNDPSRHIEKVAEKFAKELRGQYNNIFAMNIVSNMKEQGLLKDDVVKMLLEEKA